MNETHADPLLELTPSDRWLAGLFLLIMMPVIGGSIIFVQKQPASTLLGWVAKWCIIEFFTVSLVFMLLLFLWAVFQSQCLAGPLMVAKRNLTRWLVSLAVITAIGNLIVWILAKHFGW